MRILVCNWKDMAHSKAGGAEVYTHEIAKHWVASGHEVTWFSASVDGHPAEERTADGIRIVRRGSRLGVYRAFRKFWEEQAAGQFDLVIDEVNTKPFGTPHFVRRTAHCAFIHQVCREIWFKEMPLPVALAGRYVLEPRWLRAYRDTPVLTVSDSSRRSLEDYGLTRIALVPEGADPADRPCVEREARPTIVFVGRLTGSKRPEDALRAFELVRREVTDAQMWFVGDGPLAARLRAKAAAGVTFFGRVDDAMKESLMARAHVLVVTSVREGWGLVVDEAAAVGTPAIGYDVPGLRDSLAAARGTAVVASPVALAAALVQRLPDLVVNPAPAGWAGGAVPWAQVADAFLDTAMSVCSDQSAGVPPE